MTLLLLVCQDCGYKGFPERTEHCPMCDGLMIPQAELGTDEFDIDPSIPDEKVYFDEV